MQMARGAVEGGYNLGVGEPIIIQKHVKFPHFNAPRGPFEYPTMDGRPDLVWELKDLHPGVEHVVIANGGKQALAAAFYAYKEARGKTHVEHAAPYWPSYPTLARFAGMTFGSFGESYEDSIKVITSPNNPDGGFGQPGASCDVWDAVYASKTYGWMGIEPTYGVRIGSASKLMGLSGVRIGWALTNDADLAAMMRRYVEFTTSGVSVLAQEYVCDALAHMSTAQLSEGFARARRDMLSNGNSLKHLLGSHLAEIKGVPADGTGMFAWVLPKSPDAFLAACEAGKVAVVTGAACGRPGWVRLNMCAGMSHTKKALSIIAENLQR
jgi:aspartate/methionine/tyrosine aminotransferase